MNIKSFYFFFLMAVLVDLIIFPLLGALPWLPRFTIATLPFVFLLTPTTMVGVLFILAALFFWLTTGINLGIIVFSLGTTLFFERWVILKFFHSDAWQTLAVSGGGVLVFGVVLIILTEIFSGQGTLLRLSFLVSLILGSILASVITIYFKRIFKHASR